MDCLCYWRGLLANSRLLSFGRVKSCVSISNYAVVGAPTPALFKGSTVNLYILWQEWSPVHYFSPYFLAVNTLRTLKNTQTNSLMKHYFRFSHISGSSPWVILLPRACLAAFGDSFGCHTFRVPLALVWTAMMRLKLQHAGQPPMVKNYQAQMSTFERKLELH